jgi:hypothetical protein
MFPAYTPWRYQFTKLSFLTMWHSLWTIIVSIYANAAVLLQFLLMMQTLPFTLQVKLTICMVLSVIQHHLLFSFSSVSISGVSYILEWNLLVKTFSLICKLFSCLKQTHQEIVVSLMASLFAGMQLMYISYRNISLQLMMHMYLTTLIW